MRMYYKFIYYPDGHGSAHLMDDKLNELGLVALFPNKDIMLEIEKELGSPSPEVIIKYEVR
jgi:hypothetical protein